MGAKHVAMHDLSCANCCNGGGLVLLNELNFEEKIVFVIGWPCLGFYLM